MAVMISAATPIAGRYSSSGLSFLLIISVSYVSELLFSELTLISSTLPTVFLLIITLLSDSFLPFSLTFLMFPSMPNVTINPVVPSPVPSAGLAKGYSNTVLNPQPAQTNPILDAAAGPKCNLIWAESEG